MFEDLEVTFHWKEGFPCLNDYLSGEEGKAYGQGTVARGEEAYKMLVNLVIADREAFNRGVHETYGGYDKSCFTISYMDYSIEDRFDLGDLMRNGNRDDIGEAIFSHYIPDKDDNHNAILACRDGFCLEEELYLEEHPEIRAVLAEHRADTYWYLVDETANQNLLVSVSEMPASLEKFGAVQFTGLLRAWDDREHGDVQEIIDAKLGQEHGKLLLAEARYSPADMRTISDRFREGFVATLIPNEDMKRERDLDLLKVDVRTWNDVLEDDSNTNFTHEVFEGTIAASKLSKILESENRNYSWQGGYHVPVCRETKDVVVYFDGVAIEQCDFVEGDGKAVNPNSGILHTEGHVSEDVEAIGRILQAVGYHNKYLAHDEKLDLQNFLREIKDPEEVRKYCAEIVRKYENLPSRATKDRYRFYRRLANCDPEATDAGRIASAMVYEMARDGLEAAQIRKVLGYCKDESLLNEGKKFMKSDEFMTIRQAFDKGKGNEKR